MTQRLTPNKDLTIYGPVKTGGLQKILETAGRLPPVALKITPLDPAIEPTFLDRALNYKFDSSILVPVDQFSFSVASPDSVLPIPQIIHDGDVISLYANNVPICTGIIDSTEVEVDREFGEKVSIDGRNLLSQLEDQDAVSIDSTQIWGNNLTVDGVMQILLNSTRVPKDILKPDAPKKAYLFATEPGEKKLQALLRYLEPLNCLVWLNPQGKVVIGRPSQFDPPSGLIFCSRTKRDANVLDIRAHRSSATIPNMILPIWSGQESVQAAVGKEQVLLNKAKGPDRLRRLGHHLPRAVVVSNPRSADPQEFPDVTNIQVANQAQNVNKAGGSNLLQAYGKKEIARANKDELIVTAVVPGHYNENGMPYLIDQTYKVQFDRGDVDEIMYLFQVSYEMSEEGQKTTLYLCRQNTLVSDIRAL